MEAASARRRDRVVRRSRCNRQPLSVDALLLTAVLPGSGAGGCNLQIYARHFRGLFYLKTRPNQIDHAIIISPISD